MLCSHCNKKEANFHYKQVNNGSYTELHLCSDCAKDLGYLVNSDAVSRTRKADTGTQRAQL